MNSNASHVARLLVAEESANQIDHPRRVRRPNMPKE